MTTRVNLAPPDPEACLIHSRVASYKGGTLIDETVKDLAEHLRRIVDVDGYRPERCPRCEHQRLHMHDRIERKPRGEAGLPVVVVARYICAGCGATWRILPAFLPRHLWRVWRTVERRSKRGRGISRPLTARTGTHLSARACSWSNSKRNRPNSDASIRSSPSDAGCGRLTEGERADGMEQPSEPLRAAIIDDDRLMRQLVRTTLEAGGYSVVEGETGAAGLRLAQQRPDVMVLDLNLPDLNGLAICRAVRSSALTADVAIVFLTGTNDERTVVSCLQAGANDYVSKPFAPAVLRARVDAVVKARRAEQARRRFVDELSEAYRSLREARAESILQHKLSGLGVLAAGIAHEMNTPLGALIASLQFAADDDEKTDEEMKEALADSLTAAQRISELVIRMRAIAGTGERDLKEIDLRVRCEQVCKAFSEQPVSFHIVGSGVLLTAVETEVREALMALVENAVQAVSAEQEPQVQVTVAAAGEMASVIIDDNGPGIDAADMPFLFDPFFTRKKVWKTSGLGLSIAQAAARRHGGDVQVEAHGPMGGARATISLPLKAVLQDGSERR